MRKKSVPVEGFAGRLKAARVSANMTQEKAAKRIHVHRTTYTKYETGAAEPPLKTAYELALLFGTSLDRLLGPD